MSIFTKLLGIDKLKKKAATFQNIIFPASPIYLNWGKESTAYQNNDTVYTVIKKIGLKGSSIPVYTYRTKSEQKARRYKYAPANNIQKLNLMKVKALDEIDDNNPLAKLIQRPNPFQGSDAFFEGIFSFRALRGEAFIWLNRGGIEGGLPLEMYLIPPENMHLVPDPQDPWGILGYMFEASGRQIPLLKDDVIHWRSFNPNFDVTTREHLRGFDPMKPLTKRVQQDTDSADAAVAMFQQGGAKGVLYDESMLDLTPEQDSQLNAVIKNKINNKDMKAAVAQLQGKWGYLNLGLSSVDMELLKAQEIGLQRICMALGVDPDLLIPGQAFANKEWAQKKFVTDLIMPLAFSLRDELNRVLMPLFNGLFIDFDFSMLPELQEDYANMSTVYNSMFDRGAINGREYRELLGFDPSYMPEHDQYLITGNYGLLGDVNAPIEPDPNVGKYNDYME